MKVAIKNSKAKGIIKAPSSKSLAHRYVIGAMLAGDESIITNVDISEDIKASIECAKTLGADIKIDNNTITVIANAFPLGDELVFNCNESGSTIRFFMGIAMALGIPSKFYGSPTLLSRPFGVYEEICKKQNIIFNRNDEYIYIEGKLEAGNYLVPGNISSQFITGLIYGLSLLENDSTIELSFGIESKSYINLTLQSLKDFGINVSFISDNVLYIKGNQKYISREIEVEGDYSNAAFLDAFNLLDGNVEVKGLNVNSLQGDKVYKEIYELLDKEKATIDISDCPDLGPVLMALSAVKHGAIFKGTRRLKIKESDRGAVMSQELSKFGIKTIVKENEIEVIASKLYTPSKDLYGHNDHRIVMALTLLLSVVGGVIDDAQAVNKSYPRFFEDIKSLGIEVVKNEMD